MIVRIRFAFDDHWRRALNHHHGKPGLATRADFESWIADKVNATLQVVVAEYEEALEVEPSLRGAWKPETK